MKFPALSTSKTLNFPANLMEKQKIPFQIFLRKISVQGKTNRSGKSVQALSKNNSGSISTTVTEERDRVFDSLGNDKGWIHFVGIGGCGLSALAMFALKQVKLDCSPICLLSEKMV